MHRECQERFPCHRLQRKPLVSDPGMYHGTCVTHVPWCMLGSLTSAGRENIPSIHSACATRDFAYLARGLREYPSWNKLHFANLKDKVLNPHTLTTVDRHFFHQSMVIKSLLAPHYICSRTAYMVLSAMRRCRLSNIPVWRFEGLKAIISWRHNKTTDHVIHF